MTKRTTAGAKAVVTLEITGLGSWGPECTVDQVMRQAKESAIGRIKQLIQPRYAQFHGIKLIGEPEVGAIIAEEVK